MSNSDITENPGYSIHYELNRFGEPRPVQVWHNDVKMYQHMLDSGFCGGYEPVRKLIKKWLRQAKREQAEKVVKQHG